MDLANTLIRTVLRSFYETKSILVIDALMVHSALRDDDLSHVLGMQTKELRKLCGKLREDRLVTEAYRQETREGLQRPITRTYYYIDFRPTIDAIKYRLYKLTKSVEGTLAPATERKDYCCPQCGSRWTTLEAIDNIDPTSGLFRCHRCNHILNEDTQAGKTGAGHEKQSRLMLQLEGMLSLLRRIDDSFIPENDFDTALSNAVPVVRNQLTNPINATHALDPARGPATVKGQAAQAQHIEVSLIENSSTQAAADAAAEAARKATLAAQNVLPVWHTQSTVAGDNPTTASNVPHRPSLKPDSKAEDEGAKPSIATEAADNDELAAYYAAMAAEAREAERLEAEEEEDDDDSSPANEDEDEDEEDDFEDVVDANTPLPSGTNGIGSLKNSTATTAATSASAGRSSGSSSSGTGTPLMESTETKSVGSLKRASQEQESGEGTETKKIKLEPGDEDSEEDEEDVEFEDV